MNAVARLARAGLGLPPAPPRTLAPRITEILVVGGGRSESVPVTGPRAGLLTVAPTEQFTLVTRGVVPVGEPRGGPGEVVARLDRDPALTGIVEQIADVAADGTFRQETTVLRRPGALPPRVLAWTVSLRRGGRVAATADARVELVTVEGLADLLDPVEPTYPGGLTHLEFVAAVRRLYQNLALFRLLIGRHAYVPRFGGAGPRLARVRERLGAYTLSYAGADRVDVGHVLVGIEAHPTQDPRPVVDVLRVDLALTWSGDLGSVVANYAASRAFPGRLPKQATWPWERFVEAYAGPGDLLGDVDGLNLGAVYDPAASLADNLRRYYGGPVTARWTTFCADTRDDVGAAVLTPVPGSSPPRFTDAARAFVARETARFAVWFLLGNGVPDLPQPFLAMLEPDSHEVLAITDHFLSVVSRGLVAEAAP